MPRPFDGPCRRVGVGGQDENPDGSCAVKELSCINILLTQESCINILRTQRDVAMFKELFSVSDVLGPLRPC